MPESALTALQPTGLLCDLIPEDPGVRLNNPHPRFSWIVNDLAPGTFQTAFRILVASSLEKLHQDEGDLWDSGSVNPGKAWASVPQSLHVPYAGKPLAAHARCWWKVRTWNNRSQPGPWSEPQMFQTGELCEAPATPARPLQRHAVEPVRLVQLTPAHAFCDFGRAAFGTLQLTLTAPAGGGTVVIHLGEVPAGPFAVGRNPGGSRRYKRLELPLQPGRHTCTLAIPPGDRNTRQDSGAILMPPEIGEVFPFRYCELENLPAPLARGDIRQVAVSCPFDTQAARFHSSSRVLNDVWSLCQYSIQATTFCNLYVDGDRERIPYEADAYINQLGHYACDREYTLARRTHEHLLAHPTWPTEWILHSVLMAWADYLHTGDTSCLARHYGTLQAKTLRGLARADGLISTQTGLATPELLQSIRLKGELRDIVDWPQSERDGYDLRPVNTVVNAFHCRALSLMSRIAAALGKAEDARVYAALAETARRALLAACFDSQRGVFVDGEGSSHAALHANMLPLAFGLVPEAHCASVAALVKSRGMACSVYGAQYLLEALYEAREAAAAFALLTATHDRSWAHMLYTAGSTITMEAWDNRFKPNQDWNHAWGAVPANIIPRCLMGVRPLQAGFGEVLIEPQPGPLEYAEMTVPTIRGPITVRFNQRPGEFFHLETEIPANVSARISLPRLNTQGWVTAGGIRTAARAEKDRLVLDGIGSGRHTFAVHA